MDTLGLLSLAVIFFCLIGLSWFAGSDAPYVPTKMDLIRKILKKAGVKKNTVFYELGSGDGRVVLTAAEMGGKSFGIEQSWIRVFSSRLQARQKHLSLAKFFHGNLFDRNYYPADVVYIYLLQPAVDKLEKKLRQELKPKATVITQRYHFKHWKPKEKIADFWIYQQTGKAT